MTVALPDVSVAVPSTSPAAFRTSTVPVATGFDSTIYVDRRLAPRATSRDVALTTAAVGSIATMIGSWSLERYGVGAYRFVML
jgi:hypothetical protein